MNLNSLKRVSELVLASLLLTGCLLMRARQNTRALEALATVQGALTSEVPADRVAYVALLRQADQGWVRQTSRLLTAPGTFEFLCLPGQIQVFAFVDRDLDGKWSVGEPSAAFGPREVSGDGLEQVTLATVAGGPAPLIPVDATQAPLADELVRVHHGDLARLEEARFGPEAGELGLWQPADFARRYGVGVSFLEPYDPARTPVLFVHGAGGAPQDFARLVSALDRSRFQAWVYSYPSGIRLELAGKTLLRIVDGLHHRLRFERLLVVAHSMGGLVAREFVAEVGTRAHGYVRLLVTVSTPFAGQESAGAGVHNSPVVLPCWRDLAAGSAFLRSVGRPLGRVEHHLFFGFVGGIGRAGPTDGTVSMRSMLRPEVQLAAAKVRGLPEDHSSILASAELAREVRQSLREAPR